MRLRPSAIRLGILGGSTFAYTQGPPPSPAAPTRIVGTDRVLVSRETQELPPTASTSQSKAQVRAEPATAHRRMKGRADSPVLSGSSPCE